MKDSKEKEHRISNLKDMINNVKEDDSASQLDYEEDEDYLLDEIGGSYIMRKDYSDNKIMNFIPSTLVYGIISIDEKGNIKGLKVGNATVLITLDANGKVPSSQIPGGGGGGSEVTPNPAGAATADLEKVDIDGTVFNVLANAVHKTGDESIAGTKTFTGNVVLQNLPF